MSKSKLAGSLNANTFLGSDIRVSRKVGGSTIVSNAQPVTNFNNATGALTVTNEATDPLFSDAVADDDDTDTRNDEGYQCRFDDRDTYLDDNTALDSTAPNGGVNGEADGTDADQLGECNPMPKDGYEILGTNLITIDSKAPQAAGRRRRHGHWVERCHEEGTCGPERQGELHQGCLC